eukprot:sb/3476387/
MRYPSLLVENISNTNPFFTVYPHPFDPNLPSPNPNRLIPQLPTQDVLDESVEKWNTIRIWEASLESGPELLLQFYIAFCTNIYSITSLTLSFVSLIQAAAEYYYCKADGKFCLDFVL